MKKFTYTIQDAIGLHARPAAELVKCAKKFQSKVTVCAGGKQSDATRLMALIGMCIKCGSEVTVTADGADEKECITAVQSFFNKIFDRTVKSHDHKKRKTA